MIVILEAIWNAVAPLVPYALAVAVLVAVLSVLAARRGRGVQPAEAFGVDVVIGLMGHGKSLWLMKRMVKALVEEERPVFSTVDIKRRVLKKYLDRKYKRPDLVNLVFALDVGHFKRFIVRAVKLERDMAAARAECGTKGLEFRMERFMRSWHERNGEHVLEGEGANWIVPGALILYDEMHLDFPGGAQGRSLDEPEELRGYFAMMRHHGHKLLAVCQVEKRLSVTVRSFAGFAWLVTDLAHERLAYNIRLGMFFPLMGGVTRVRKYRMESGEADLSDKLQERWIWRRFAKHYFKLYRSQMHAGSKRRLKAMSRKFKEERGVVSALPAGNVVRTPGYVRWGRRFLFVAACAGSYGYGMMRGDPRSVTVVEPAPIEGGGLVQGVGRDWVMIRSKRRRVGDVHESGSVLAIVPGECIYTDRGYVYRWVRGDEVRVGPVEEVARRVVAHSANVGVGAAVPKPAFGGG